MPKKEPRKLGDIYVYVYISPGFQGSCSMLCGISYHLALWASFLWHVASSESHREDTQVKGES